MSKVTALSATQVAPTEPRSTKITEELLLCRLCSLKYSASGRRPIALRCLHTFCECCLEQLLRDQTDDDDVARNQKGQRRNKRQQLVCPTCDAVTPLGRGCSPSSLPVNPSIMDLLQIFNRPAPVGRNEAIGFSQVKVNSVGTRGHGSTASGVVNSESKNKELGSSKGEQGPVTNGNDPGGVSQGYVNWVSTVNIGGSAVGLQQQQQQRDSSSSSKHTPTAAPVTSGVTSFSTLRIQPDQSSSSLVSPPDTNTGSSLQSKSALQDVAHTCCRCGLRPAAVSVASSSQTMAPQKLCSDCWKQSALRKKKGALYGAGTTVSGTETSTGMDTSKKQVTDGTISTSRISTGKTNVKSGLGVLSETPTNGITSTGLRTVHEDNAATRNVVVGDRPSGGFVTNGKSTIEVRRRSYVDNRSQPPPMSSTNDSGAATDTARTGNTSTNEPVSFVVGSGGFEPQPAASTLRLPITDSAPTGAQPPRTEATSTSSGSNVNVGRDAGRRMEHDEHHNLVRNSSAPSIAQIHPLPCNNPPYNPEFDDDREAANWPTSQHNQRDDYSTTVLTLAPSNRPNLSTLESRDQERLQRKQQEQQDLSATAGNRGMPLSFMLAKSGHGYLPEQPPKYEDIIRESGPATATAPDVIAGSGPTQSSPPASTLSEPSAASSSAAVAMRLVRSFGKYGEISTQPGVFQAPRRISASPDVVADDKVTEPGWTSCRVVVGDRANGTVQVFSETGECLSMLRADAVAGCCLLNDNQRLIVATDRGLETYDINGSRQDSLPMGAVVNVVPYERGFIAVQSKSLSIFKGMSFSTRSRTLTSKAKPGQFNRLLQFDDICDVAVNSQQDLVVLEAPSGGLITVMTDDGYIKSTIDPSKLDGCGCLQAPSVVAVDSAHNIVVSESGSGGRILLFGANGRLQRVLLGPTSPPPLNRVGNVEVQSGPWPSGLAVSPDDRLYVVMRGDKFAEIRIYEYI